MLTVSYERLGLRAGERILDLGCGAGRHSFEALRRGGRVVAADLDDVALKDVFQMGRAMTAEGEVPSGGSLTCARADARRLPFADRAFDRIIVSEVLEHIDEDLVAMGELARVLAPGGTLAVTIPRTWPEQVCWWLSDEYHSAAGGHVRIYRRSEVMGRLYAAGFEVTGHHYAHALHSPYWWLKCAVGVRNDDALPVRLYHSFLVWDIMRRPPVVRALERALDPVMGKSLVVYARHRNE
jgi:SAM-dependent methyltransferase